MFICFVGFILGILKKISSDMKNHFSFGSEIELNVQLIFYSEKGIKVKIAFARMLKTIN